MNIFDHFRKLVELAFGKTPELAPASVGRNSREGREFKDMPQLVVRGNDAFPDVDWEKAWEWFDSIAVAKRSDAALAFQLHWLENLAAKLGPRYVVHELEDILLVTCLNLQVVEQIGNLRSKLVRALREKLGEIVVPAGYGKLVCVLVEERELYYSYISSDAHPEVQSSDGICIDDGTLQVVINCTEASPSLKPVLVHEMTHAALADRRLPPWLGEGLALVMEEEVCGRMGKPLFTRFDYVEFFRAHGFDEFLSGDTFEYADDAVTASYQLSYRIVRYLWQSSELLDYIESISDDSNHRSGSTRETELRRLCDQLCSLE